MRVRTHATPAAFRERALPFLLPQEAEHNLFFGLLEPIEAGGYPEYWLATLEDGEVRGCALQTPPFPVIVSALSPAAQAALVEDLLARRPRLEGVNGPVATCEAFAAAWCARAGATSAVAMRQGTFALDAVIPPARPPRGALRVMGPEDLALVTEWIGAFHAEAGGVARTDAATSAREKLAQGSAFLWDDGGPVSLACFAGPTPHGIRINAVYTPPALRGRGYASAAVAALSQRLLDGGRRFCFLFTDLESPTSNKIYQALGYRRVCETTVLRFAYED